MLWYSVLAASGDETPPSRPAILGIPREQLFAVPLWRVITIAIGIETVVEQVRVT